ncbi:MAG TPA: M48 family metallopeptidase [Bauldia sp.]|nr:M48 family metallopeptidase [Bauldia sp.]
MRSYGLRTHIWNNRLKSVLLLIGFPVLLLLIAYAVALFIAAFDAYSVEEGFRDAVGLMPSVVPVVLVVALVWWIIAWFANQSIIDAITGARPVDRKAEPRLWNLLENLCISRGITMPTLRVIETPQRNAFASGIREKQYSITVTRGLMDALEDAELEAVLAHELTHIRNRDVQLLVISAVFVGVISLVGELIVRSPRALLNVASRSTRGSGRGKGGGAMIILILVAIGIFILARFLGIALRFALSRKREYLADAGSVELTRNPDAMIGALRKIAGHSEIAAPAQVRAMFIDYPEGAGIVSWFATHPPIESRIAALVRYAGGLDLPVNPQSANAEAVRSDNDGVASAVPAAPGAIEDGPWGRGGA